MLLAKPVTVRSKALRDSAKGKHCTVNLSGCLWTTDTTVLAHLPDGKPGMGSKSSDLSACYACDYCHGVIDGRYQGEELPAEVEKAMRQAQIKTLHMMLAEGLISVRGMK